MQKTLAEMNRYSYQAEKLSLARSSLMLPHTEGEAQSIASAFFACTLGFRDMNENELDENAREWVRTIKGFMDTEGIQDPEGKGTFLLKARTLDTNQQRELSDAINELASWFKYHDE